LPALESLVSQSLEKPAYEILIVDNASTDDTRRVIEEFQKKHSTPTIRYLYEARQGLAYARNTGWSNARGRYVAFIDDDCSASLQWLQELLNGFEQVRPDPWSVGGPILPAYDQAKPDWFRDNYETDTWGEQPRWLKKGESFTGCNMALQRDVLDRFGGFDVDLGMNGQRMALAEDTRLFRRMWAAEGDGGIFYYAPRAIMYHTIDPYKMTVAYQLKRAFTTGQASWAMAKKERLLHRAMLVAWTVTLIPWHTGRALLKIRIGPWHNWAIESLYPLVANVGRLLGSLGIRVAPRQRSDEIQVIN
jgi:glycosyltransferase involved in cell wall biosynthesis